ncbi:MAG: 5'-methylthioadenosine/S-adenosylhomocysteine nucleosidase [Bacteroidales bacterium]|nr:5'-methylthioadenosine/S-adenosylhomocysteine nucleosidase [Bacteroidales bacterium]
MNILVLTAMDSEYDHFASMIDGKEIKDKNIILAKCGIGKVNAAVETFDLIQKTNPDIVVSSGVAGGCGDNIEIMDTVCAESICYHDVWCGTPNKPGQIQGMPEQYPAPKRTIDKIKALNLKNVKFGLTVSGDWFVDRSEKMQEIKTNFPNALAVDMESAAIAHVCYKMNVPFISLRIISDLPMKGNNHQQYKDFWKNVADNSFDTAKRIISSI